MVIFCAGLFIRLLRFRFERKRIYEEMNVGKKARNTVHNQFVLNFSISSHQELCATSGNVCCILSSCSPCCSSHFRSLSVVFKPDGNYAINIPAPCCSYSAKRPRGENVSHKYGPIFRPKQYSCAFADCTRAG